ncbi:MAG: hypothetical protein U9R25_19245 [Chloroflexota bacterium]|nr:hypothetical protein [Chloroflexota bacterium]
MAINWDENLNELRVDGGQISAVKCGVLPASEAYNLEDGEQYFQLISANFINEIDARGQHSLYVDVVDENSNRLDGTTVVHGWPWKKWPDEDEHVSEKIFGAHLANWGIYANYDPNKEEYGPYWAKVDGKSDVFYGMGLPWNRHVSWSLVFQRAVAGDSRGDISPPPAPDESVVVKKLESIEDRLLALETELRALREALAERDDHPIT